MYIQINIIAATKQSQPKQLQLEGSIFYTIAIWLLLYSQHTFSLLAFN